MRTAVIYASTHGTTEKVATKIREEIGTATTDLFDLKKKPDIDLNCYDTIIIGGSVHAGSMQMSVKKFCRTHQTILLKKKLGLFMCGMNVPEFDKQFEKAFQAELRNHATSYCYAGGEFLFEKMNFFQRAIITKISGVKSSVSQISEKKIGAFAEALK
jgi:menaquinone-dependent protoporphyrinogen oxidase